MNVIYLASPYSYNSNIPGLSRAIRYYRNYKITKIAGKLHDHHPNAAFILPITTSHQTARYMASSTTAFVAWAARDLEFISRSDELWVVTMSGWKESIGVQAEIRFAKKKKIPVKYINPETLTFEDLSIAKSTNSKKGRSRSTNYSFSNTFHNSPSRPRFCIK